MVIAFDVDRIPVDKKAGRFCTHRADQRAGHSIFGQYPIELSLSNQRHGETELVVVTTVQQVVQITRPGYFLQSSPAEDCAYRARFEDVSEIRGQAITDVNTAAGDPARAMPRPRRGLGHISGSRNF